MGEAEMNMTGFEKISDTLLTPGEIYFLRNRWGNGLVKASESTPDGWTVELQQDAAFTPPLKKYRVGDLMNVPPGVGQFYEVKG